MIDFKVSRSEQQIIFWTKMTKKAVTAGCEVYLEVLVSQKNMAVIVTFLSKNGGKKSSLHVLNR